LFVTTAALNQAVLVPLCNILRASTRFVSTWIRVRNVSYAYSIFQRYVRTYADVFYFSVRENIL